jgi:hypothetical protein
MGASHHSSSPDEREAFDKFMAQLMGDKRRSWPQGRISGEDDGATAFAVAADPIKQVILIRFPKPMDWIGLGVKEAKQMRDMLTQKIEELTAPRLP